MRNGECRGRFPRIKIDRSFFDELGALHLKHREEWLNTFCIILTYLLRCNTDVTCLLSGTQVWAIIAYVTDYMTKLQLKTYTLFEVIHFVFSNNSEIIAETEDHAMLARRLLTKMITGINACLEVGGPMLCAHLLGNPEYYISHKFTVLFWYPYVRHVANYWKISLSKSGNICVRDTVTIVSRNQHLLPNTKMNDYIYRPPQFENCSLYDFI